MNSRQDMGYGEQEKRWVLNGIPSNRDSDVRAGFGSGAWVVLLVLVALIGCGGGRGSTYRLRGDGTVECSGSRNNIYLRALYLNRADVGVEGIVPVAWWEVLQIDMKNSRGPVAVPVDLNRFTLIDTDGKRYSPLSANDVLTYASPIIGKLLRYQKSAIRRAIWRGEALEAGQFGAGYLFFAKLPEGRKLGHLVYDPDPELPDDEITLSFIPPAK